MFVHSSVFTAELLLNSCPIFLLCVVFILCLTQFPLAFSLKPHSLLHRSYVCILLLWGLQISSSWVLFDTIIYAWSLSTWTWHIVCFVAAHECCWLWIPLVSHCSETDCRVHWEDLKPWDCFLRGGQGWSWVGSLIGGDFGSSSGRLGLFECCQAKRKVLIYHRVFRAACRN